MTKDLKNILNQKGLVAVSTPFKEGNTWIVPVVKIDILKQIEDHVMKDKDKTVEAINEVLDYASYLYRLHNLTKEEQEDFVNTMEGPVLTEPMKETLKNSNEKQKEYYLNMWARSTYFKRCAWLNYLYGDTEDKPFQSEQQ